MSTAQTLAAALRKWAANHQGGNDDYAFAEVCNRAADELGSGVVKANDLEERQPTIAEMRRVAKYLEEVMHLYSAAGKLLAKADQLERLAHELMEHKR